VTQADLQRLYASVFSGESRCIPLIVSPPCPGGPAKEELVRDPEGAVVRAAEALRPKVNAGSDWIPTVNISWYQCIVVPSLFGARPVFPEGSEPIVEPFFRTVAEAADAGAPPVDGPVVEEMLTTLHKAAAGLPDGFALSFPPTASPLDLAQLLLPADEFLASLLTTPETARTFLDNLTTLCLQVFALTRSRLAGTAGETVTNRGLHFPGLRLPCDAIVNLSPRLIRDIALPVLERFGESFGRLCIHYCTKPAPSAHVLPALRQCPCVAAVDTWQGPDAFFGDTAAAGDMRRVALVFDVDLTTEEKMTALMDWPPVRAALSGVGDPLVLHTYAASVEDARRIYAAWLTKTGQ
jgi:hypothetical protein